MWMEGHGFPNVKNNLVEWIEPSQMTQWSKFGTTWLLELCRSTGLLIPNFPNARFAGIKDKMHWVEWYFKARLFPAGSRERFSSVLLLIDFCSLISTKKLASHFLIEFFVYVLIWSRTYLRGHVNFLKSLVPKIPIQEVEWRLPLSYRNFHPQLKLASLQLLLATTFVFKCN